MFWFVGVIDSEGNRYRYNICHNIIKYPDRFKYLIFDDEDFLTEVVSKDFLISCFKLGIEIEGISFHKYKKNVSIFGATECAPKFENDIVPLKEEILVSKDNIQFNEKVCHGFDVDYSCRLIKTYGGFLWLDWDCNLNFVSKQEDWMKYFSIMDVCNEDKYSVERIDGNRVIQLTRKCGSTGYIDSVFALIELSLIDSKSLIGVQFNGDTLIVDALMSRYYFNISERLQAWIYRCKLVGGFFLESNVI